jgi:hypothetical protein
MNCLDYRRVLLAGEAETLEMKAHRAQCPACTELRRDHERLERELAEALAVPVPEGLEGRLEHSFLRRRRRFLAAAAVSALAVGAGTYAWLGRESPLALACIQFVMKEEAKSIMMGAMPRAQAAAALADTLPLDRIERVGQVKFVGSCPFNGQNAYHVVLVVPQGKVTLLVMPQSRLAARQQASYEGLYAAVVRLRSGALGVIGSEAQVVESVAGALRT